MVKINELLKMIESQEKAGGESCTPGTELELGENIVDSYGKVGTGNLISLGFIKTYYDSGINIKWPAPPLNVTNPLNSFKLD